ncbi:diguanylate cyclase [Paenibacillus darwinianus]|nr:EAL domain-containing protein [Paenibacillus darwinianus]EXX87363.1 diguanylate cyclase [Paenibacillus darwinianus]
MFRGQRKSEVDELSGLSNRKRFERELNAIVQAAPAGKTASVLFTDLDRFKIVNNSLGHAMGDELIREAADRVRQIVGPVHTAARFGGDEFAIILEDASPAEAKKVAERIREAFNRPFNLGLHEVHSTISIGIASFPAHGSDTAQLMKHADAAMYQAKDAGGNRTEMVDDALEMQLNNKMAMEQALWRAVDKGAFELHFQPQVDPRSRQIVGAEALVRWRQKNGSLVSPAQFIPLAEESGMIVRLGEWVLREACRQAVERENAGYAPMKISVNVSPKQLQHELFEHTVRDVLKETGFNPARLVLEITESAALKNVDETGAKLQALKRLGIGLSMDDFGTGYASIGYLKAFGVDSLKIAQSFVREMEKNNPHGEVVEAMLAVAAIMRLEVVIEGVETDKQFLYFSDRSNCLIQGYYFYRPMPLVDFPESEIRKHVV